MQLHILVSSFFTFVPSVESELLIVL